MEVRKAHVRDAKSICELVNHYAEQGLMLHRSLESTYDCLREFWVITEDDTLLACAALDVFWADLAEIRSIAVAEAGQGRGLGRILIEHALEDAKGMGISRVFAMTYEKEFFIRLGFCETPLQSLPEKIWRECLEWYDKGHRHESAMLIDLAGDAT
ncbi:MAG: N-acetyltransferase [Phycisphaerales bacterium]|jgi:amino-acid N-acetyltransferase|nr:N-acetyltransferase [Phycisphaerales bacterium]MBT7171047.1 N-acetyltransferase [Phycisphaerales bacterium]